MTNTMDILTALYREEVEICDVYGRMLFKLKEGNLHEQLYTFLNEHKKHAEKLASMVKILEGEIVIHDRNTLFDNISFSHLLKAEQNIMTAYTKASQEYIDNVKVEEMIQDHLNEEKQIHENLNKFNDRSK